MRATGVGWDHNESELFNRPPLRIDDGTAVFSDSTPYTDNYARIASDHLASLVTTGHNPFISEELWRESEASTRDLVRRYARPGSRVLDVGVGLGRLLGPLTELERFGIDISMDYLRRAAATGISVVYARVEDMPFRHGTFDLAIATDIFEHVLDLNDAVAKILDVIKPGGYLLVRSPDREDLRPYLAPGYPYEYVHLRTFDEASLRLLFTRVFRCEVVEALPCGYSAQGPYLRYHIPFPKWSGLVSRGLVGPLVRVMPFARNRVLRALYRPIELNVVIRKLLADAPAGA
jgi:SAM-dependent methyltransferase